MEDVIKLLDPQTHMGGRPPDPIGGNKADSLEASPNCLAQNREARENEEEDGKGDEQFEEKTDVQMGDAEDDSEEDVVAETPMQVR